MRRLARAFILASAVMAACAGPVYAQSSSTTVCDPATGNCVVVSGMSMLSSPQLVPSSCNGSPPSFTNICLITFPSGTRTVQFVMNPSSVAPDEVQFVVWGPLDGNFPSVVTSATPQLEPPLYGQNLSNAAGLYYNIAIDTVSGYRLGVVGYAAAAGTGGPRYIALP